MKIRLNVVFAIFLVYATHMNSQQSDSLAKKWYTIHAQTTIINQTKLTQHY